MTRSKNFTFTINNWDEKHISALNDIDCKYIVYGKEKGASGTPHLQGTIVFNNQMTEISVRKKIPGHIEVCKDLQASIEYCKKDGEVFEKGTKPMNQKEKGQCNVERYDLARKAAEEGREDDIPSDIYLRHYNTIKKIKLEHQCQPAQLDVLKNEWIYGPPGTGKTTKAMQENPGAYLKMTNEWWDGYDGQDVVIVDDFDKYHIKLTQMLKHMGQHQPFAANLKGSSACIRPQKCIITSNFSIDEIWEDTPTREAMKRRYKEIHMPKPWHYTYDNKTE